MQTIWILMRKEFRQIFRNRPMVFILTLMPLLQLIILANAATHEVKNVQLAVQDDDRSPYARRLIQKLEASPNLILAAFPRNPQAAFALLENNKADLVLHIPAHFERDFLRNRSGELMLQVNAINGSQAGIAASYVGAVVQDFRMEILREIEPGALLQASGPRIEMTYSNWYNPEMDYKTFMVPGILGELVTLIVLMLAAMNIVREKEIGTIEQLNVTPIFKYQFILGKLLPFLLIGLFDLALGLFLGKMIFQIPLEGSLLVVFAFCVVNLIAVLGIGFLISTFAETQQQAMFISWFFIVIFILMSGLFTPIESMPPWAQHLTIPNPVAHFVEVMRQVLLKGSGFWDVRDNFAVMAVMSVIFNGLAIWNYRKQT